MEKDKEEKVLALRGALKDGRRQRGIPPGGTGENPGTDTGNDDSQVGTAFQDARREVENLAGRNRHAAAGNREPGSNGRSAKEKPERVRSATGRFSKRDRSSDESLSPVTAEPAATAERTIGRLETDEPIKPRLIDPDKPPEGHFREGQGEPPPEKRGPGRPRKDTPTVASVPPIPKPAAPVKDNKLPWVGRGAVLTEKEAEALAEPFTAALEDDFRHLDEYLWARQKAVAPSPDDWIERPIWSDLDTEEVETLTRVILKRAKRSPAAAAVVRTVVDSQDYVETAVIVLPRAKRTLDVVRATRRPPKKRGER